MNKIIFFSYNKTFKSEKNIKSFLYFNKLLLNLREYVLIKNKQKYQNLLGLIIFSKINT